MQEQNSLSLSIYIYIYTSEESECGTVTASFSMFVQRRCMSRSVILISSTLLTDCTYKYSMHIKIEYIYTTQGTDEKREGKINT